MRILIFICFWAIALSSYGQLVINEYQTNNRSTLFFNQETPDWVEIYNPTATAITLRGWMLSDELNEPDKFVFQENQIAANGLYLVYATGNEGTVATNEASFALRDGSDTIYLFSPDSQLVDYLYTDCVPTDKSFGRYNQTATLRWLNEPTPNALNTSDSITITRYQDSLQASHASGFFTDAFEVSLSVTDPRTAIYYSLDGDEADLTEAIYTEPLEMYNKRHQKDKFADEPTSPLWNEPKGKVFKAQVVRARGYFEGCPVTDELFRTFVIDENAEAKYRTTVFSLIVEGDDFFDDKEGIYVPGNTFIPSLDGSTGNYFQKGGAWERDVHVEAFEANRTPIIKQNARVRINGNTSRSYPQKSLRLYGESNENPTQGFNYAFFDDRPFSNYPTLILRTAGADISNTFFKDVLCHELAKSLNVDYQSYRQTVVLINGEYWGIHNLRERQDEHYIKRLYNLDQGHYDLISLSDFNRGFYEIVEGDRQELDELMQYVRTHDLADNQQFDTLYQLIDMENFIDYHILQLFVANEDWLNSNTKVWKEKGENGKWRWLFFDCDRCFSDLDNSRLNVLLGNVEETSWSDRATELQRAMLKNERFKAQFYGRFLWAMEKVFTTGNMLKHIEELEAAYEPLAPEHIYRWQIPKAVYAWHDNVQDLKAFALYRPLEMMEQLEANFGSPYQLYPNPASQQFAVKRIDENAGTANLVIYSAQGEIIDIKNNYSFHTPISLSHYAPGYYIVRITTGELVFSLPLVVLQ